MTGAVMQLVSYGAQDIFLTGNPAITYFKGVYRRHTNFAIENIQQTLSGQVGFGGTAESILLRNGDLIIGLLLEIQIPALTNGAWIHDIGNYIVKQVDIEIGGQLIDRHYSDWLEIWSQLTVSSSHRLGYNQMIGEGYVDNTGNYTGLQSVGTHAAQKLTVPLQFWFCRNVGLALPLIALQYHEVKLIIAFSNLSDLIVSGTTNDNLTCDLYADYIYLDTDERRRFAQVSHEYLIEQVQFNGTEQYAGAGESVSYTLQFNHPVKELIWTCQDTSNKVVAVNELERNAIMIGGQDNDRIRRIHVDENFIYICGESQGPILNGFTEQSPIAPNFCGFIAKLNKNNYSPVWSRWIVQAQAQMIFIRDIKTDKQGNIYCIISISGTGVVIDGQNYAIAGLGGNSILVVKFNANGVVLWVNALGTDILSDGYIMFTMGNMTIDDDSIYIPSFAEACSVDFSITRTRAATGEITSSQSRTYYNFGADGLNSFTGGVVYRLSYDGTVQLCIVLTTLAARNCVLTSDGFLAITGDSFGPPLQSDVIIFNQNAVEINRQRFDFAGGTTFLIKVSKANGNVQWFRSINNTSIGFNVNKSAAADGAGNIILCATVDAAAGQVNVSNAQGITVTGLINRPVVQTGLLVKFDSVGTVVFYRWLGNDLNDIQTYLDNNIILRAGATDFIATDQNGTVLYQKTITVVTDFRGGLTTFRNTIYITGQQNNTNQLTVTNIVNANVTNTENYTYPVNPGGLNGFIYVYKFGGYDRPDPYSVGTEEKGADNFAPFIGGRNPVSSATLYINGTERFATKSGDYFNLMQPFYHHTCIPKSRGINVYSFAMKPEEHQPSGTCNFSRIDKSQLLLTYANNLTGGVMKVFATNYNVLRVMSGMGGLAYSN